MSIAVTTEDGITRIELARPERKNAISVAMYEQLAQAFEAVGADVDARAVLVQGDHEVFCAGNDLNDFLGQKTAGALDQVRRFMVALTDCPVPVVASVTGAAVGIGTTLLWHCDLVYAADNAMFSMPFVNLGLCPEFGSSLLVTQSAGYHRAAEKLLLGEPILAEEAVEMGLVNRILPPLEVREYAWRQAARFRGMSPAAVRETKRLLRSPLRGELMRLIDEEIAGFTRLLAGADAREAIQAFLERRKPDFARKS